MTDQRPHIVIGAGSGMGEAVAKRMDGTGPLVLADIDEDALERVASTCNGQVRTAVCDITSRTQVEALLATADGSFRSLIVTAGLSPTMGSGERIIEVDLVGPATVVDVFDSSVTRGSVAVLFASIAGHLQAPDEATDAAIDDALSPSLIDRLHKAGVAYEDPGTAYMVAKRGLLRLVRRKAATWGTAGGRLLSVSPGIVDTPMGRQEAATQDVMADMVSATPLGRMLLAEEVADVACFLASDAAAAMTGSDVLVDGGFISLMS